MFFLVLSLVFTTIYFFFKPKKEKQCFVVRIHANAILPTKGSVESAGYDLHSIYNISIPARDKIMVDTGLMFQCPEGTYGRIAPRSGLAAKLNIDVDAGVIDRDYRGEIKVILRNHGDEPVQLPKGKAIAQLIFETIESPEIIELETLPDTNRGTGGFGSTG